MFYQISGTLTLQSFCPWIVSVQILFTVGMLTFSHFSLSTNLTWTLWSCSRFLAHPSVVQCMAGDMTSFSSGRQTGRTKSLNVTGWSRRIRDTVLPSTGDFTFGRKKFVWS